jgi:hypothetical protein
LINQGRTNELSTPDAMKRRHESPVTELFFVAGTVVIVVGLIYAIHLSWPSFTPLVLAMLVGVGLLLVVVCERLRLILREVEAIAGDLRSLRSETASAVGAAPEASVRETPPASRLASSPPPAP